ncbi:DUF421 domain-containing protein [Massilibacterium senegalense]|uniref:DUF421 domain-containing protein n=1 Tax=Massilibacterium senegalense TaxID=1632858 RepID=UPI0007842CCB|nr:DUF421 domain-containing protein [Massilibacterium senegalense]
MQFLHLSLELIIGFFALMLVTKALGKTQITQITPFDFISALVLGELVGNAIYDKDIHIWYILYAVLLWGVLVASIEFITQKLRKTRTWLEGEPSIVIYKGQVNFQALKKNRLDLNQLQHLLRDKDVFSMKDVEYAVLETNGVVNVLKKSLQQNATRKDVQAQEEKVVLPVMFISDGDIIWENIREQNLTKEWLDGQLKVHGIHNIKEVLFAEWTEGEGLYVQKK